MMRKTIILILATLIAASGSEALAQTGNFSSTSGEKNEINLNPVKKGKGDDKSLFAEVEAWYDSSSRGRIYAAVKYNGKWKACIIETRTKE